MKGTLNSLIIGLALLAGVHPSPAQPTLSIAPAGNQALLSWPVTTANYILQSTTNLASPYWVWANDAVPAIAGGQTALTVTVPSTARFFRLFQIPTTTDGMVLIPAGSFRMGDTLDFDKQTYRHDNYPPINVTVSAFYMDVNLVTYSQWESVYNWATNNGYNFDNPGSGVAPNHPVQTVDWYDSVKWCNARSQLAGLTPVYYTDTGFTQIYTNSEVDLTEANVNWSANGYRLPTEAEWEKAARGGLSGQRFPWGDTISLNQANYISAYLNNIDMPYDLGPYDGDNINFDYGTYPYTYTSPVGYFAPNGYGLYDMAGNVIEWCWDWYAPPPYPTGSPYLGGSDPHGPASSPESARVNRNGGWASVASASRCAFRESDTWPSNLAYSNIGFRCVRGH